MSKSKRTNEKINLIGRYRVKGGAIGISTRLNIIECFPLKFQVQTSYPYTHCFY